MTKTVDAEVTNHEERNGGVEGGKTTGVSVKHEGEIYKVQTTCSTSSPPLSLLCKIHPFLLLVT